MLNIVSYTEIFKEATLEIRGALKIAPHCHRCHAWLAKIYISQSRLSLASIHLRKALQANPTDMFVQSVQSEIDAVTTSADSRAKSTSKRILLGKWSHFSTS